MTIQDNYQKTKEKVKKLEQKIEHLEASLKWHKKIIKDAWWILTDIQSNDLNADIHIFGVASMLSDIAVSVLDEEHEAKTNDK
jgi:hypothetical protein